LNQQNAPAAPLPDVVATVDGQEIKKEELEQAFATELARQGIPPDQLPANQKAQGYKMILNDLITEKLVSKRAAAMSPYVSPYIPFSFSCRACYARACDA
jgi:hypothetical protein